MTTTRTRTSELTGGPRRRDIGRGAIKLKGVIEAGDHLKPYDTPVLGGGRRRRRRRRRRRGGAGAARRGPAAGGQDRR